MHDKDELVRRLHSAVEERLGPDAFLVDGERLASNHVIYTSGLDLSTKS